VWEVKAKQEKAAHKAKYPDYRFRPVHNKKKQNAAPGSPEYEAQNQKQQQTPEEAQRCDDLAQLLLEGKKGDELARAVRDLERQRARAMEHNGGGNDYADYENGFGHSGQDRRQSFNPNFAMPMPMSTSSSSLLQVPFTAPFGYGGMNPHHHQHHAAYHRRSSSVPLPNEWFAFAHSQTNPLNHNHGGGITLPSIPPFASSSSSNINHHDGQPRYDHPEDDNDVLEQFTNPFLTQYANAGSSTSANDHQDNQHENQNQQHQNDNRHLHHHTNAPNSNFQFPLFAPQPQFAGLSSSFFNGSNGNGMNITPRSSYGHRRASSAQPILRRSWTMDDAFGSYGFASANGMMERDPEPLPEVNTEFFASDFSFTSPSNASSATSGGVGIGSGSATGVDERGLSMASASAIGSMGAGMGADLDLVDPATPLSAIHPRIQPQHHSHTHSHSHSQTHAQSLSLSGIDTALAGVRFSSNNSSAGASGLLSTSASASPAASSTMTIDSPAPPSLSDAADGLPILSGNNTHQFVDPNTAYNMNVYVQYGQQQPDELASMYTTASCEDTPAAATTNNNMGAGGTSGVDSSYPSPFGSLYVLQSYDQPQQHLHGGMVVSPDIGGGASGGDATVMYDHGDIAYEVDQTGHGHVDGYLEYNLGMTKMQHQHQHQPQLGMDMGIGVGVSSGGYYDGVSA